MLFIMDCYRRHLAEKGCIGKDFSAFWKNISIIRNINKIAVVIYLKLSRDDISHIFSVDRLKCREVGETGFSFQ